MVWRRLKVYLEGSRQLVGKVEHLFGWWLLLSSKAIRHFYRGSASKTEAGRHQERGHRWNVKFHHLHPNISLEVGGWLRWLVTFFPMTLGCLLLFFCFVFFNEIESCLSSLVLWSKFLLEGTLSDEWGDFIPDKVKFTLSLVCIKPTHSSKSAKVHQGSSQPPWDTRPASKFPILWNLENPWLFRGMGMIVKWIQL